MSSAELSSSGATIKTTHVRPLRQFLLRHFRGQAAQKDVNADDAWANLKAHFFLLITQLAVLAVFAFVLFHDVRKLADLRASALLVFLGCALPPVLSRASYLLINKRAVNLRLQLALPDDLNSSIADKVRSCWNYEILRSCRSLSRAECFSSLWGLTASLTLVGAASLTMPTTTSGFAVSSLTRDAAFAVVGACSVSFLLELVRVCVRSANDDATKRMFAEALRGLVLSVVVTLVVMLLPTLIGPDEAAPHAAAPLGTRPLGIGAGAAILGVSAFEFARSRLMTLLKINTVQTLDSTPLTALTGMSAPEIARLAEEGIDSIEELVNTPIPRLFLSTRFSLRQLCDWADRGVLLTRLGVESAGKLRDSTGIARASELKREIMCGDAERQRLEGALQRAMHLESGDGAAMAAAAIARDETIETLLATAQTVISTPAAAEYLVWQSSVAT